MSHNPYNQPLISDNTYANGNPQQPYQGGQQYAAPQQYPPPPGYQQPPPQASGQGYSYDPYHIQYNPNVTVQDWKNVPNDQSQYSYYWSQPDSFQPETFARNTQPEKSKKQWNDLFWNIFFWVNFVATIALAAFIGYSVYKNVNDKSRNSAEDKEEMTKQTFMRDFGIGVGVGVALNIIHFVYASYAPLIYIKLGLWIGVILAVILALIPYFAFKVYYFFIYPAFFLIISIVVFCMMYRYIPFSAAVLQKTCWIIRHYPSIIMICIFQFFLNIIICSIFSVLVVGIAYLKWSYAIYVYVLFSFYWTITTLGYVIYMTGAGLASSWYFLYDTPYFPRHPTWESFKRAMTTSFGSASLAGFLLAVVETLKAIIEQRTDDSVTAIFQCIALCILSCLECLIKWLNRYALIYCATFGVPYVEACRRWAELSCKKFADVILSGCCISKAVGFNMFTFIIGGGLVGFGLGYMFDAKGYYIHAIATCVIAFFLTVCGFSVLEQPLLTISDTIIVCFAECPERLSTSAHDFYDAMCEAYGSNLRYNAKKLQKKQNKKK